MKLSEATLAAIAGQACGDSFGAPYEYQPNAPEMAQLSMDEERYVCSKDDVGQPRPEFWRMPGVYTDDTQQALLLMWLWMNAKDPTDAKQIRREFMRWCQIMAREDIPGSGFGIHRGTGANFREAVERGAPIKTAGLGAPMRIGPVATMMEDPALVMPWSVQVSLATTKDPISIAGTVLFAMVCWQQAHPGALSSPKDWGQVPAVIVDAWKTYLPALRILRIEGEDALLEFASRNGSNKKLDCAANGFALTGVPWAILHGYQSPTYSEALLKTAASGGDTDTVCAMAGCLSAIRLGKDAIPSWMTKKLEGWDHIQDPTSWDPWESEMPLTEADAGFRRDFSGFRRATLNIPTN